LSVCQGSLITLNNAFFDSGARLIIDPKHVSLLNDFELMETNKHESSEERNSSDEIFDEPTKEFSKQVNKLKISNFANDEESQLQTNIQTQTHTNSFNLYSDFSAFKPEVAAKLMEIFKQYATNAEHFLQLYAFYSTSPNLNYLSEHGKKKNQFVLKNIERLLLDSDLVQEVRHFFELYQQQQEQQP
jgi:hypothetical protein